MADDPRSSVDRQLRNAFEAQPGAAARVARQALANVPSPRRRGWAGAAAAVAVIGVAATLAFWPSSPVPSVEPGSPRLSGFLSGGLVVLTLPDGSIAISGGEARTDRPPDGYGVVLAEGELR